jgi:hypothetical protein
MTCQLIKSCVIETENCFGAPMRAGSNKKGRNKRVGSLPDIANGQAQAIGNWLANLSQ